MSHRFTQGEQTSTSRQRKSSCNRLRGNVHKGSGWRIGLAYPGSYSPDESHGTLPNSNGISTVSTQADLQKEIGAPSHHGTSTSLLNHPSHNGELCAA